MKILLGVIVVSVLVIQTSAFAQAPTDAAQQPMQGTQFTDKVPQFTPEELSKAFVEKDGQRFTIDLGLLRSEASYWHAASDYNKSIIEHLTEENKLLRAKLTSPQQTKEITPPVVKTTPDVSTSKPEKK